LRPSDVYDKGGGEVVTVADLAAEAALSEGLKKLIPASIVVGEEASDRDPALLLALANHDRVLLVDALDGTHHFAAGQEAWGVMVALLRKGQVEAAWIHLPMKSQAVWGSRDSGVFLDGVPVHWSEAPSLDVMHGVIFSRFMPEDLKTSVERGARKLNRVDGDHQCAAQHYVELISGAQHFAVYYRTSPWDHAAGAFLAERCGAVARRFDNRSYLPGDGERGLLIAPNTNTWRELRNLLLPGVTDHSEEVPR
jgi:fructose-1,6-bisphosphatase/inositol monophosphatase family enzyme